MTTDVADQTAAPPAGEAPSAAPDPGTQPPPAPANEAPADSASNPAPPTPAIDAAPTPKAPEPERLTPEEWQQRQQAQQDAQAERDRQQRLKSLKLNAPMEVRDAFDDLSERLGVAIPKDLREPVLNKINEVLDAADEAARLALGDEYEGDRAILRDTTRAFIANVPEAQRGQFAEKVRGQDPDVWVKTLLDVAKPAIEATVRTDFIGAHAALLPEGKTRDDFTTKAKTLTKTSDIAQAFHDSLVGVVGPKGEPQIASRGISEATPLTTDDARTLPVAELVKRRAAARS